MYGVSLSQNRAYGRVKPGDYETTVVVCEGRGESFLDLVGMTINLLHSEPVEEALPASGSRSKNRD